MSINKRAFIVNWCCPSRCPGIIYYIVHNRHLLKNENDHEHILKHPRCASIFSPLFMAIKLTKQLIIAKKKSFFLTSRLRINLHWTMNSVIHWFWHMTIWLLAYHRQHFADKIAAQPLGRTCTQIKQRNALTNSLPPALSAKENAKLSHEQKKKWKIQLKKPFFWWLLLKIIGHFSILIPWPHSIQQFCFLHFIINFLAPYLLAATCIIIKRKRKTISKKWKYVLCRQTWRWIRDGIITCQQNTKKNEPPTTNLCRLRPDLDGYYQPPWLCCKQGPGLAFLPAEVFRAPQNLIPPTCQNQRRIFDKKWFI